MIVPKLFPFGGKCLRGTPLITCHKNTIKLQYFIVCVIVVVVVMAGHNVLRSHIYNLIKILFCEGG